MIDLYSGRTPNVRKVILMLEECGLEYHMIPFNVWRGGEQFKPAFKTISPNSKIPAIVDYEGPNGKPFTLGESGAILIYLAEKTGKFMPKDPAARYHVIQWVMIQMASVGPISGQLMHFRRYAPGDHPYSLSRYLTEMHRLYDVLDERLTESRYLGGPEYGIADMATFPWIEAREPLGVKLDTRPHVQRWCDEIHARPATKRMLEQVNALPGTQATATPDDLDRIFGRGPYARA